MTTASKDGTGDVMDDAPKQRVILARDLNKHIVSERYSPRARPRTS